MIFTAGMVIVKDFLTGVLAAIIIYAVFYRYFDRTPVKDNAQEEASAA